MMVIVRQSFNYGNAETTIQGRAPGKRQLVLDAGLSLSRLSCRRNDHPPEL
jgi:hypothetical protein